MGTNSSHVLLFERDQQLTTLLTSEFQLAGYECHAARTAVEVFDAIARHPVRLALVNLAQAAAGRREFWVALDAQRRGRGVQVFTYRCTNLAGYGVEDPEERGRSALADLEVDGMLGVMSLIDAVRARLAGSNTSALSRIQAVPVSGGQTAGGTGMAEGSVTVPANSPTQPVPIVMPNSTLASLAGAAYSRQQPPSPLASPPTLQTSAQTPPSVESSAPTYTDRIRAIIYPSQGAWNVSGAGAGQTNSGPQSSQSFSSAPELSGAGAGMNVSPSASPPLRPTSWQAVGTTGIVEQPRPQTPPRAPLAPDSLQATMSRPKEESGLAQLSRMVQKQYTVAQEEEEQEVKQETQIRPAVAERQPMSTSANISTSAMRASPIQDVPVERASGGLVEDDARRSVMYGQPKVEYRMDQPSLVAGEAEERRLEGSGNEHALFQQVQAGMQEVLRRGETRVSVASDTMLLDIVQSLPPMPSPPQPSAVLSGRATRSLGSVLLEGHLVPQNRLEVAQSVQRMLRGVDLNYQLGEILLMFKLLTPDQLLAASLVSYGLISTTQISVLGRIRQELYSIGLEYDLENLLILFRVLTPEQLREVRSSWT